MTPTPPMRRAMKHAEEKLKARGIKIVEWEPYRHQAAFDLLVSTITAILKLYSDNQGALFFADGGASHKQVLGDSGEPVHRLTEFVMSGATKMSFDRYWKCNTEREALREEYHKLIKDRGVDVILCPPTNGSASLQGNNEYWFYTGLWNILDQPAAVFPTGLVVDVELDPVDREYTPLNDHDSREFKKCKHLLCISLRIITNSIPDSPDLCAGSPLCLQVVGKHFHDEETLAATRIIEQALLL